MNEEARALALIRQFADRTAKSSEVSQESVVLAPDELDDALLKDVVIWTLPQWLMVDMFGWDKADRTYTVYFIRDAEGRNDPFIEGIIDEQGKVIWSQMRN